MQIFLDETRLEMIDEKHSQEEDRYITIGRAKDENVVYVVHTEFFYEDDTLVRRIISARPVEPDEEEKYYEYRAFLLKREL